MEIKIKFLINNENILINFANSSYKPTNILIRWAATVAWFRWHLGGERNRKADFVGTNGKYINWPIVGHQGNWKGVCKNF